MESRELAKNVFLVRLRTKRELAYTFVRFQEHYESPRFRGKVFSMKEYMDWYVRESPKGKKTGKFTYNLDWSGFNIPSYILEPFYKGRFNPLSSRERALLKLFKDRRKKRFYVIGIFKRGKLSILKHEIAHGLFYTNKEYRKEVLRALRSVKKRHLRELEKYLMSFQAYHRDTWMDETHAYLLADLPHLKRKGVETKNLKGLSAELNSIFRKYAANITVTK